MAAPCVRQFLPPCHAVSILRHTPQQAEDYKAGSNRNPAALRGARPSARPRAVPCAPSRLGCRFARRRCVGRMSGFGPPARLVRSSGLSRPPRRVWAVGPAFARPRFAPPDTLPAACARALVPPFVSRFGLRPAMRPPPSSVRPSSLCRSVLASVALGARWGGPPSPLRDLQT